MKEEKASSYFDFWDEKFTSQKTVKPLPTVKDIFKVGTRVIAMPANSRNWYVATVTEHYADSYGTFCGIGIVFDTPMFQPVYCSLHNVSATNKLASNVIVFNEEEFLAHGGIL